MEHSLPFLNIMAAILQTRLIKGKLVTCVDNARNARATRAYIKNKSGGISKVSVRFH